MLLYSLCKINRQIQENYENKKHQLFTTLNFEMLKAIHNNSNHFKWNSKHSSLKVILHAAYTIAQKSDMNNLITKQV